MEAVLELVAEGVADRILKNLVSSARTIVPPSRLMVLPVEIESVQKFSTLETYSRTGALDSSSGIEMVESHNLKPQIAQTTELFWWSWRAASAFKLYTIPANLSDSLRQVGGWLI